MIARVVDTYGAGLLDTTELSVGLPVVDLAFLGAVVDHIALRAALLSLPGSAVATDVFFTGGH